MCSSYLSHASTSRQKNEKTLHGYERGGGGQENTCVYCFGTIISNLILFTIISYRIEKITNNVSVTDKTQTSNALGVNRIFQALVLIWSKMLAWQNKKSFTFQKISQCKCWHIYCYWKSHCSKIQMWHFISEQ